MNILVACEFSGVVRDTLIANGHNAVSCDLLPTESPGPHIQDDVLNHLIGWDMLIAHPPCTYLTVSGNKWMKEEYKYRFPNRLKQREEALEFVNKLLNSGIPKICLENPIGVISSRIRKPDQIIQPWMFGHGETKATCLWLKNLPQLIPTNIVEGRVQRLHYLPPSKNRWKLRSTTYQGIAKAMADQWAPKINIINGTHTQSK